MKLKEQISKDYMSAFKAKDNTAKNVLSVIKGEIQTLEKNTGVDCLSDEDVLKILTKTSKSIKETLQFTSDTNPDFSELTNQLNIVNTYLPKLMSRTEVEAKVNEIINSGENSIGGIMKAFATLPADKKIVSTVVKEILG